MRLGQQIPDGYHLDFEEYLFNTLGHRTTQTASGWRSFYLIDDEKKLVTASWHLHCSDNKCKNPYRATFGGIDFSNKLSIDQLSIFIREVCNQLSGSAIEVVLAPSIHDQDSSSKLLHTILENGFSINRSMLVSALEVDDKSFESKINATKRNILNKSELIEVSQLPLNKYPDVYNCIEKSQTERNYSLSLTVEELKKIIENNARHFQFYGAYIGDQMVAAIIIIMVRSDINYVFYAGHLKEYDKLSPLIKLYGKIYKDCQRSNVRLIDLGSSEEDGSTKQSLLDFKSSLGAECGIKLTLIKQLNE